MPVQVCVYLHSHQCVDPVGEEQFAASFWLPGDPQVQETNSKITLITEDGLLHTHTERRERKLILKNCQSRCNKVNNMLLQF